MIAAHNEGAALGKTVQSCVETCAGLDYEIVIADDASWDGCIAETCKRFPQVRIVRHEKRLGPSPTKDLGARQARGEVLVFLDGHTKPEPGAIRRLVESVEWQRGEAIITPAITGLNVGCWKSIPQQIGHGYFLELERFDCGWLPLSALKKVSHRGRVFYESPAAIGCAFAVHRELYDDLRGFDPHMRSWGVEDLDFSLKCWLLGHPILHDPAAVIAHRFREKFDNYHVPMQDLIANQLRMAYKNFTPINLAGMGRTLPSSLSEPPPRAPGRSVGLRLGTFPAAARERRRRARLFAVPPPDGDEFWYAERFGLSWPALRRMHAEQMEIFPRTFETTLAAKPSPSCDTVSISFSADTVKTGLTKPLPPLMKKKCNINDFTIATQVVATVKPASAVGDVVISKTGISRFNFVGKNVVDAKKGTIKFKIEGTSMTPINKKVGDSWLVAKIGGRICEKVPVVVLQPWSLKPVSTKKTKVNGKNEDATNCSSPAYITSVLRKDRVYLWTVYGVTQSVPVLDQFGDFLGKMYDGAPVYEFSDRRSGGDGFWHPINVKLKGGKYPDPVGGFIPRPGKQIFKNDDPVAVGWTKAAVTPSGTKTFPQNFAVMIAGVKLSPGGTTRKAVVEQLNLTQANITIDWKESVLF